MGAVVESVRPAVLRQTLPVVEEIRRLPLFLRSYAEDALYHHLCHGDVFYRRFGSRSLNFGHPRLVKHVLRTEVRNYVKSEHYRSLDALLGQGIFVSEGQLWTRQRRLLAPEFRAKEVERFVPLIVTEVERLCERWDAAAAAGEAVQVNSSMMELTLAVVGGAIFKTNFRPHAEVIAEAMEICLAQGTREMLSMGLLQSWMPTPGNRRARAARDRFDDVVDELIAASKSVSESPRAGASEAGGCPFHGGGGGGPAGVDMVSRMLAARDDKGRPMSHQQVRDEVKSLILSGHETTSLVLAWAMYLLTEHPEIADRVRAEVEAVAGAGPLGASEVERLVYTRQVLLEAMRLYPPVPGVSREAVEDDEVDGIRVRAGEVVVISIYSVHRHPDFWDEPERFEPERFAPDRIEAIEPYAYLPFLRGRRACIGEHFAMLEAILAFAMIVSRYRFERSDDLPIGPRPMSTLRMTNPLNVTLRRVD